MTKKDDVSVSWSDPTFSLTIYASLGERTVSASCSYESWGQPHGPEMLLVPRAAFRTWSDGSPIDLATQKAIVAAIDAAPIPVMWRWS